MKKLIRICCILLTACMLLAMMPAGVRAAQNVSTSDSTDFVLVLDCSGSLVGSDKELAISACKMFVDLVPVENARVSVLVMGTPGSKDKVYTFSEGFLSDVKEYESDGTMTRPFGSATKENLNSLYTVVDLDGASTLAVKQTYKDQIVRASKQIGQQTPITHALAAALDLLEANGTESGNGCVVLLTDGQMTSGEKNESDALKDWVIKKSKGKEWPIYCIDTNFGRDVDRGLLNEISMGSGYANGKMKSESAVEICGHFLEIFNHFMENKNGDQQTVELKNGVAEYSFAIPMLSSETNIVVAASNAKRGLEISKVELYKAGSDKPIVTVTENDANKEIGNPVSVMAVAEPGVYFCVKMIAPTAGDYVLRAYGKEDSDASILIYDSSLQEMDLAMTTDPVATNGAISIGRDQSIDINAAFSYAGYKVGTTDEIERGYYERQTAELYVYDEQDNVLFHEQMSVGDNGYHYNLKFNETTLPSDKELRLAVKIDKNEMYRTGEKESNSIWFIAENQPPIPVPNPPVPIYLEGHVNMELEDDILMGNLYTESDGDIMTYELTDFKQVLSNGTVSIQPFESGVRENTDALWIRAGLKPGKYTATLRLVEVCSGLSVDIPIEMEIENDPLEYEEIKPIEIWTDFFPLFQNDEHLEWEIDLSEHFSDYEQVPISYSVSETAASGLLNLSHTDGSAVIHLEAAGEELGKTSITIVAKQFAGDEVIDSKEVTIPVAIKSGRAEFWKDNWIWFALSLAVLVAIVLTIILLVKNKRVKGEWEITIDDNGDSGRIDKLSISDFTTVGKRGKFLLKDLVTELLPYLDYSLSLPSVLDYFTGNGADQIELIGVVRKKGCKIAKVPGDESGVNVSCNGIAAKKKKNDFAGGTLMVVIDKRDTGDRLTIEMRLW